MDKHIANNLNVVSGVASDGTGKIEIDDYVPLRLRTYEPPLGCGYVRLGRRPTSLLELIMEPETQALRGLTLVSAPEASSWPAFSVLRTSAQFPALSVAVEGGKFIDLEQDFRVSARENEIVLFWDELGACVAYGGERWRWLVRDGVVRGTWFSGLTKEEITRFISHFRR